MTFTTSATDATITAGTEELSSIAGDADGVVTVDNTGYLPVYTITQIINVNQDTTLKITTPGIYHFPDIEPNIDLKTSALDNGASIEIGTDDGDNSKIDIIIDTNKDQLANFAVNKGFINAQGLSNVKIYGAYIRGLVSPGFQKYDTAPSNLVMKNVVWDCSGATTDYFIRITGETWSSTNTHFSGMSIFPGRKFAQFKNAVIDNCNYVIGMNWGKDAIHENYIFEGLTVKNINSGLCQVATRADVAPKGAVVDLLNSDSAIIGTENTVAPRSDDAYNDERSIGTVIKTSTLNVDCVDFDTGAAAEFTLYTIDSDSGNRTTSEADDDAVNADGEQVTHHYNTDLIINEYVASGSFSGKIVKAVFNRPLSHYNSNPTDSVSWDVRLPISWNLWSYKYGSVAGTLSGNVTGIQNIPLSLVVDPDVTETTKATVAAYTILDTPQKIYDYAKYLKTTTEYVHKPEPGKLLIEKSGLELKTNYTNIQLYEFADYWSALIYAVGKNVTYNSKLYTCTTAVTAPEAFDSAKWTEVNPIFEKDSTTIVINVGLGGLARDEKFATTLSASGTISQIDGATTTMNINDSLSDSMITFILPTGFAVHGIYASLEDADIAQFEIPGSLNNTFSYLSASRGGTTIYIKAVKPNAEIIEPYTLPTEQGFYTRNVIVTDIEAALAEIRENTTLNTNLNAINEWVDQSDTVVDTDSAYYNLIKDVNGNIIARIKAYDSDGTTEVLFKDHKILKRVDV